MSDFQKALKEWFAIWGALLWLLSLGRAYFFWDFLEPGVLEESPFNEIISIFWMALRLDLSAATLLLSLPALMILGGLGWKQAPYSQGWQRAFGFWSLGALGLTALLLTVNHYYFFYYKDHFNIFFWEFWLNWENAQLVIGSLFDELPMGQAFGMLGAYALIGYGGFRLLRWGLPQCFFPRHAQGWVMLSCVALLLLGIRGTWGRPLPVQRQDGLISQNPYLNFTHSNPFYALYFSWNEIIRYGNRMENEFLRETSPQAVQEALTHYARLDERRSLRVTPEGQTRLEYQVPVLGQHYLKRPPKHVVLIFMESLSAWPATWKEEGFDQLVMGNFQKIQAQSLTFNQYFQAGSGTIENIAKAVLGVPTSPDLPLEITFKEAYEPFPSSLPAIMAQLGYRPRFFYGGSLAWHRLYYFLEKVGFQAVYGESNVSGVPKTYFGLYDQGLFEFVHRQLLNAEGPTFDFVMTLSNHPPYNVPPEFKPSITIPSSLQDRVKDTDYFLKRFRGFAYSDKALGEFLEKAQSAPYFKETLFIITADHVMNRRIKFRLPDHYRVEKIPLLFYAPDLLKEAPATLEARGTHLDLIPTLASLLTPHPFQIHSWGRSLLAPFPTNDLYAFRLKCLDEVCLYKNQSFRVEAETERLIPCESLFCWKQSEAIWGNRQALEKSGLAYFFTLPR